MPTAYPPINRYSTRFELSDFKNSLKSLASAGIAIEGPSQEFERPQPLFDWTGQPVLNRIVRIRQAHHGKLRPVQPEVLEPILGRGAHNYSLPPPPLPSQLLEARGDGAGAGGHQPDILAARPVDLPLHHR